MAVWAFADVGSAVHLFRHKRARVATRDSAPAAGSSGVDASTSTRWTSLQCYSSWTRSVQLSYVPVRWTGAAPSAGPETQSTPFDLVILVLLAKIGPGVRRLPSQVAVGRPVGNQPGKLTIDQASGSWPLRGSGVAIRPGPKKLPVR